MNDKEYDVGVIVGRFHTPQLHDSHKRLFDFVCSRHKKVICYLGLSPLKCTKRNPLDFHQRKVMIEEDYPDVQCFYIKDAKYNEDWSRNLDEQISDMLLPGHKPLLYGSRDSFIKSYLGKFDTYELKATSFISATEIRKDTVRDIVANKDVRIGMIVASASKYPTSYTTVDVAILNKKHTKILLGRKAYDSKFRFIGGFSDPSSKSLEEDARREVLEETNIQIGKLSYICSKKIDDWRYKFEEDCIKTTFWAGEHISGTPKAGDDIVEVRWFDIKDFVNDGFMPTLNPKNIVDEHKPLLVELINFISE